MATVPTATANTNPVQQVPSASVPAIQVRIEQVVQEPLANRMRAWWEVKGNYSLEQRVAFLENLLFTVVTQQPTPQFLYGEILFNRAFIAPQTLFSPEEQIHLNAAAARRGLVFIPAAHLPPPPLSEPGSSAENVTAEVGSLPTFLASQDLTAAGISASATEPLQSLAQSKNKIPADKDSTESDASLRRIPQRTKFRRRKAASKRARTQ